MLITAAASAAATAGAAGAGRAASAAGAVGAASAGGTVSLLTAIREVQIPVLASMLLIGCGAKLVRVLRMGSAGGGLGPTALFPLRARRPLALLMCGLEFGFGAGLIITAGTIGRGAAAFSVRLGTGLLFGVGICALIELRTSRPDVGCGCFGDFSAAPVSDRTLARSGLLAAAAFGTIGLPPLELPRPGSAALFLGLFAAEIAVLAALSPELAEGLVLLGYSEPCELRTLPVERTLTALRRSAQWRKHAGLITADLPVDTWREMCWRYLVFPSRAGERETELVFAVYQRQRRPAVLAALVDKVTCEALPWPEPPSRAAWLTGRGKRGADPDRRAAETVSAR
jgi:hypothetical protein